MIRRLLFPVSPNAYNENSRLIYTWGVNLTDYGNIFSSILPCQFFDIREKAT